MPKAQIKDHGQIQIKNLNQIKTVSFIIRFLFIYLITIQAVFFIVCMTWIIFLRYIWVFIWLNVTIGISVNGFCIFRNLILFWLWSKIGHILFIYYVMIYFIFVSVKLSTVKSGNRSNRRVTKWETVLILNLWFIFLANVKDWSVLGPDFLFFFE